MRKKEATRGILTGLTTEATQGQSRQAGLRNVFGQATTRGLGGLNADPLSVLVRMAAAIKMIIPRGGPDDEFT